MERECTEPTKTAGEDATNKAASNRWLTTGALNPETEGLAVAMQDGAIRTASYRVNVLKERIYPNCRACETTD